MPLSSIVSMRLIQVCLMMAVALLSACQSLPPTHDNQANLTLSDSDALFGTAPVMPDPNEIHALDEDQQADFLQYFHNPARAAVPDYQRVGDYLEARVRNFNYRTDTFGAAYTLQSNSGNCLSLAVLATALAHLAGVETAYQLMDSEPVFEFHGTTVEKGVHVRTLLLDPNRTVPPLGASEEQGIRIDFFPTFRERFVRNMLNEEYVAMYYRNIANEALRANDLHTAYWYARESLSYHPDSADALNTMAIVTRRAGHPLVAEAIYLYAIEHAKEKLTLLKNYRLLLASSGRQDEAELVDRQLRRMQDPSPFNWFQLARSSFDDGDYERAIDYYRRALTLAPYLHEAHLGISRSYAELGYRDESLRSLVAAIDNAGRLRDRKFYKAKLSQFQN